MQRLDADDCTDILAPATSPWLAAFGLGVWQIAIFVITALLTITTVQSLTAMMRDWLDRLSEDHRPASAIVSRHRAAVIQQQIHTTGMD